MRGGAAHGENAQAVDVVHLAAHEVQDVRHRLVDAPAVPLPHGHGGQQDVVLVVAVDEASGPRLVLDPLEPVGVDGAAVPHVAEVPGDDHDVASREVAPLRPAARREAVAAALGRAVQIARDVDHVGLPSISNRDSLPQAKRQAT